MSAHSPVTVTGQIGEAVIHREFDDFYRAEFAGLVVLATGVLGRRNGAEDLVQEALLEAYRRWDRVGAYDAPRAWLRLVIVQRAVKQHRKRTNERTAHVRAVPRGDSSEFGSEELDPVLREQLQALPAQQRAALALHYLEDCPISEIAEMLGIAEGTVKVHLSRGRVRLADALTGDPQEKDTR